MPLINCCGSGILPFASWDISFRICPNCLTSWFTACTVVPDPRAIRFRDTVVLAIGPFQGGSEVQRALV